MKKMHAVLMAVLSMTMGFPAVQVDDRIYRYSEHGGLMRPADSGSIGFSDAGMSVQFNGIIRWQTRARQT